MAETTIYVCTTCKMPDDPSDLRAGQRLCDILQNAITVSGAPFRVEGVECLSVCKRPCTVAFAAAGKWTYVYGDFSPESAPATLLEGAKLYAETVDGLIPWKQRPDALKKGVIARLPPSLYPSNLSEPIP
jgi:predicted metal-binding protein